jgi:hypothetical protein
LLLIATTEDRTGSIWARVGAEYGAGFINVINKTSSHTPRDNCLDNVTNRNKVMSESRLAHFERKKTGEAVELDGRHAAIWEARGGKWLILDEHFSAPLS